MASTIEETASTTNVLLVEPPLPTPRVPYSNNTLLRVWSSEWEVADQKQADMEQEQLEMEQLQLDANNVLSDVKQMRLEEETTRLEGGKSRLEMIQWRLETYMNLSRMVTMRYGTRWMQVEADMLLAVTAQMLSETLRMLCETDKNAPPHEEWAAEMDRTRVRREKLDASIDSLEERLEQLGEGYRCRWGRSIDRHIALRA